MLIHSHITMKYMKMKYINKVINYINYGTRNIYKKVKHPTNNNKKKNIITDINHYNVINNLLI